MWLWHILVGHRQPVAVWSLLLLERSFKTSVNLRQRERTDRRAPYAATVDTRTATVDFTADLIAKYSSMNNSMPFINSKYNRTRQLYKNISMLFLFPVKDGKLSTGVIAIFNASCYG